MAVLGVAPAGAAAPQEAGNTTHINAVTATTPANLLFRFSKKRAYKVKDAGSFVPASF